MKWDRETVQPDQPVSQISERQPNLHYTLASAIEIEPTAFVAVTCSQQINNPNGPVPVPQQTL